MGIARNGEIQKFKLMASVLKRNNPTPGLLKTREMGEAASCPNGIWGWPAKWGKRPAAQTGYGAGRER